MEGEKLGLVGKIILGAGALAGILSGNANGGELGSLKVENKLSLETESNKVYAQYTTDGKPDSPWPGIPAGSIIYIDNNNTPFYIDSRISDSLDSNNGIFNTKLVYAGETPTQTNNSKFCFPSPAYSFGSQHIIFDSNSLKYGKRVNVRNAIANNSGNVQMKDLPAKSNPGYNPSTPYASGNLMIGTEPLAELTNDDLVDFKDFTVIANDWGKTGEGLAGDISGPNGIPDGIVDNYDLEALSQDWLQ